MPNRLLLGDYYLIVLVALAAWREAAGEGIEGMRAVMHVIANRQRAGWGDWDRVITRKNQFTSMSVRGDPQLTVWPDDDLPLFQQALEVANRVFYGRDGDDPTGGALYYENPRYVTSEWFMREIRNNPEKHPRTAVIGQHVFYA